MSEQEYSWLDFGGMCPVQGYGEVNGHFCYFRARGIGWRLEIYAKDSGVSEENFGTVDVEPLFVYGEQTYTWPEAGYLEDDVVLKHFSDAAQRFRRGEPSSFPKPTRQQKYDMYKRCGLKPMFALRLVYGPVELVQWKRR